MTEMINPVEPFDGVPIQVPSQIANPPMGGTGVFGRVSTSIANLAEELTETPKEEKSLIEQLIDYQGHDERLPLQYWIPDEYDRWWIDQERKRLDLSETSALPEEMEPTLAQVEGIDTSAGRGGNLRKVYNTRGGEGSEFSQTRGVSDNVWNRVRRFGIGLISSAAGPAAPGVALALDKVLPKSNPMGNVGDVSGGQAFSSQQNFSSAGLTMAANSGRFSPSTSEASDFKANFNYETGQRTGATDKDKGRNNNNRYSVGKAGDISGGQPFASGKRTGASDKDKKRNNNKRNSGSSSSGGGDARDSSPGP